MCVEQRCIVLHKRTSLTVETAVRIGWRLCNNMWTEVLSFFSRRVEHRPPFFPCNPPLILMKWFFHTGLVHRTELNILSLPQKCDCTCGWATQSTSELWIHFFCEGDTMQAVTYSIKMACMPQLGCQKSTCTCRWKWVQPCPPQVTDPNWFCYYETIYHNMYRHAKACNAFHITCYISKFISIAIMLPWREIEHRPCHTCVCEARVEASDSNCKPRLCILHMPSVHGQFNINMVVAQAYLYWVSLRTWIIKNLRCCMDFPCACWCMRGSYTDMVFLIVPHGQVRLSEGSKLPAHTMTNCGTGWNVRLHVQPWTTKDMKTTILFKLLPSVCGN